MSDNIERQLTADGPDPGQRSPRSCAPTTAAEFTTAENIAWPRVIGVEAAPVEKASPQQNCFVERFNLTMRDELNGEWRLTRSGGPATCTTWAASRSTPAHQHRQVRSR